MANSTIKTRIQLKCDTEANWKKSVLESEGGEKVSGTSFIPLRGELIVYSADMAHPFSRLKIGDGITNVVMLPFIDAETLGGVNINNIVNTYATKESVNELFTAANVTYTVTTGTENGKIKVIPSNGSAYEVAVYGLRALAYKDNLIENDIPDLNWSKITNKPIASSNTLGIVKIGNGISINNDGVMSVSAGNLGLSGALRYQGTTTTTMQDGRTTAIVTINNSDFTPTAGDVVIYNDAEYLWTGTLWELLGAESSFKKVQTAITAPAAETNKWVSSIGQDANGNINTTYSVLNTSGTWSGTATKALQDGNGNEISLSYVKYSQGKAVDLSIEENLSILTIDEDVIRGIYFKQPTTCAYDGTAGVFCLATPDDDIVDYTRFEFRQFSASSSTKKFTTNYDTFVLPLTSFDKTTDNLYAILTTKTTTSIGSENNPVFFNSQGQPQACGDTTSTSTKKLEAISAAGKIGFYSNGTSTLGITITTKDNITSFPIRMSSTTDSGVQLGIYKQVNLRQNLLIWPSAANSTIGDIVFYRSSGGSEITDGTKTWGQGTFGRITYEGPYSENVNGENTAYTTSRFAFKQYSHSNSTANSYYDIFRLPSTSGNTGNHAYSILTSKYVVTIGQGGTGASNAYTARKNLELGLTSTPQFQGLILHNQNESALYTGLTLDLKEAYNSSINLYENGYLRINIANLQNENSYRGIQLDSSATMKEALTFFDHTANGTTNYKIYHSGNLADLANDLTPYFQNANGVNF